jgi:hypothetical protein
METRRQLSDLFSAASRGGGGVFVKVESNSMKQNVNSTTRGRVILGLGVQLRGQMQRREVISLGWVQTPHPAESHMDSACCGAGGGGGRGDLSQKLLVLKFQCWVSVWSTAASCGNHATLMDQCSS